MSSLLAGRTISPPSSPGRRPGAVLVALATVLGSLALGFAAAPAHAATIVVNTAVSNPTSGTEDTLFTYTVTTSVAASKLKFAFNGNSTAYYAYSNQTTNLGSTDRVAVSSDRKTWTITGDLVGPGSRTVTVTAYDDAGAASAGKSFTLTVSAAPASVSITSAVPSPASGTTSTGFTYKVTTSVAATKLKFTFNGNSTTYWAYNDRTTNLGSTDTVDPGNGTNWVITGDQLNAGCPRTITVAACTSNGCGPSGTPMKVNVGGCTAPAPAPAPTPTPIPLPASTLALSGYESFPSPFYAGSPVRPTGTVTSNYTITNVIARVATPAGVVKTSQIDWPNAKTYALPNLTGLRLYELPAGAYTYTVMASDTLVTNKTLLTRTFSVIPCPAPYKVTPSQLETVYPRCYVATYITTPAFTSTNGVYQAIMGALTVCGATQIPYAGQACSVAGLLGLLGGLLADAQIADKNHAMATALAQHACLTYVPTVGALYGPGMPGFTGYRPDNGPDCTG